MIPFQYNPSPINWILQKQVFDARDILPCSPDFIWTASIKHPVSRIHANALPSLILKRLQGYSAMGTPYHHQNINQLAILPCKEIITILPTLIHSTTHYVYRYLKFYIPDILTAENASVGNNVPTHVKILCWHNLKVIEPVLPIIQMGHISRNVQNSRWDIHRELTRQFFHVG